MSEKILASKLSQSSVRANKLGAIETVDLTLVDGQGHNHSISITPLLAAELMQALGGIATFSPNATEPTKLPDEFAVGQAVHENLVLLRFGSESPYAIKPEMAQDLAFAILEECDALAERPARTLQ